MEDIFMNASNNEEVVQPQEETQSISQEFVSPEDMSDDEFRKHIQGLKDGTIEPRSAKPSQDEALAKASEEEAAVEAKAPFKSFETEEDFQGFMNKAIGDRLKKSRAEKERYEELGRRAMSFYGGENADEALGRMLDDVETQFAENSGKSKEEFAEDMRLKMDAMSYRRQLAEENQRNEMVKKIQEEWAREEDALKRAVPGFSLTKAMENPEFKSLVLDKGMSLSSAYITLTNKQERPAQRPLINEVGNQRGRAAGTGAKSPEEMNSDEFRAYIERIKEKG